jgi:hypothetical protein
MEKNTDLNIKTSVNNKIEDIFNECGIKLRDNISIIPNVNFPNKSDLKDLYHSFYNEHDENSTMYYINKYVFRKNHFRIIDADIILFDLKINESMEYDVKNIIESLIIVYGYEKLISCIFPDVTHKYSKSLMNNKEFIKNLSKELRLRIAFSTDEQLLRQFEQEISKLIEKRLIKLNIKEKADKELPKLIMDNAYFDGF